MCPSHATCHAVRIGSPRSPATCVPRCAATGHVSTIARAIPPAATSASSRSRSAGRAPPTRVAAGRGATSGSSTVVIWARPSPWRRTRPSRQSSAPGLGARGIFAWAGPSRSGRAPRRRSSRRRFRGGVDSSRLPAWPNRSTPMSVPSGRAGDRAEEAERVRMAVLHRDHRRRRGRRGTARSRIHGPPSPRPRRACAARGSRGRGSSGTRRRRPRRPRRAGPAPPPASRGCRPHADQASPRAARPASARARSRRRARGDGAARASASSGSAASAWSIGRVVRRK